METKFNCMRCLNLFVEFLNFRKKQLLLSNITNKRQFIAFNSSLLTHPYTDTHTHIGRGGQRPDEISGKKKHNKNTQKDFFFFQKTMFVCILNCK